jgi:hypothetical protein
MMFYLSHSHSMTLSMAASIRKPFLKALVVITETSRDVGKATKIIGCGVSGYLSLLGISKIIDALGNAARGNNDDDEPEVPLERSDGPPKYQASKAGQGKRGQSNLNKKLEQIVEKGILLPGCVRLRVSGALCMNHEHESNHRDPSYVLTGTVPH